MKDRALELEPSLMMNVEEVIDREIHLEPNTEFRFEVENKNEIATVILKNGFAELFGAELVKGITYTFKSGTSSGIFTWHGCTLVFRGKKNISYVSRETLMNMYLNTHGCLEEMREYADNDHSLRGPVTMIVGPSDVGKTTLSRILLNYAVRMGRTPVFVDLDVSQGSISIPGTIGATLVCKTATVNEFKHVAPFVYHYGDITPSKNPQLMKRLVTCMAKTVLEKTKSNKKVNASGVIINTCSWIRDKGYEHLIHTAQAFQANTILVIGQEKLYYQFLQNVSRFVKVVNFPISGGVVSRSEDFRSLYHEGQIKKYFYGSEFPLYPYRIDLEWADIEIYKIGAPGIPESCLPFGMKENNRSTKPVLVRPSQDILHHLLAVSYAYTADDIISTNVAGYICIIDINIKAQRLTVLSPQPGPLPNSLLILSEVKFMDM